MLIGSGEGVALLPQRGAAGDRLGQRRDPARVTRVQFGAARVGIALEPPLAIGTEHVEFVQRAAREPRNEDFPHAALAPDAHRMAAAVPQVEIARESDLPRIRRPHRERHAGHAVDRAGVRAQLFPGAQVSPFVEQPHIGFAEPGAEAVGVFDHALAERRIHLQQVLAALRQRRIAREEIAAIDRFQPSQDLPGVARQGGDGLAAGHVHAQSKVSGLRGRMRAEAAERIRAQSVTQGCGELEFGELQLGCSNRAALCGAGL